VECEGESNETDAQCVAGGFGDDRKRAGGLQLAEVPTQSVVQGEGIDGVEASGDGVKAEQLEAVAKAGHKIVPLCDFLGAGQGEHRRKQSRRSRRLGRGATSRIRTPNELRSRPKAP